MVGEDTCSCQRGRPAVFAGEGFLGRVSPLVTIVQVPTPTSAADPNTWAAVAENRLWCAENQALFGQTDLNDTAPQWRRQGIGTELLSGLERLALAEGRHTLHSWLAQVGDVDPEGPGVIAPREGSGQFDGRGPSARFMLARGYALEQVEVHSVLRVPVPPPVLEPLAAEAAAKVGAGYRLISWTDRCPDGLVDAFAGLCGAMDDAPTAGMWPAPRTGTPSGCARANGVAQRQASWCWCTWRSRCRPATSPGSPSSTGTPTVPIPPFRTTPSWSRRIAGTGWACT